MSTNDKKNEQGFADGEIDSRMVPVMREAVALVQLVFFGELKKKIAQKRRNLENQEQMWLTGAVVNNLFGSSASNDEIAAFAGSNRELIEEELRGVAGDLPDLLPYLTDALRMQAICDNQEGINSVPTLLMARTLGVLQEQRALPLPSTFMIMVRKLGAQHGLLTEMQAEKVSEEQGEVN